MCSIRPIRKSDSVRRLPTVSREQSSHRGKALKHIGRVAGSTSRSSENVFFVRCGFAKGFADDAHEERAAGWERAGYYAYVELTDRPEGHGEDGICWIEVGMGTYFVGKR